MLDTSAASRTTAAAAPSASGEAIIRVDARATNAAIIDIVRPFEPVAVVAFIALAFVTVGGESVEGRCGATFPGSARGVLKAL